MKDLFAYLFGDSQVESEVEETRAVIEKIMEEAEEQEPLKVKRTPLIAALKALGLKDVSDEVQYDPEGFSLVCKEDSEYREYVRLLMEPDAMEKLAKLGWVITRCGDVAMTNEPAEFRIRFLEITSTDDSKKDSWPTQNDKLMTSVVKKGREFMSEPGPHDDESPVEYDDKTSDDRNLGRPWKFGEALTEAGHAAGCQCGFCKNKGSFGKKAGEKARPKSDEDTESGGGDSGDSTGDSTDLKGESQEEVPYTDKTGKQRKVPWVRKPKPAPADEAEPPRYGDMYQLIKLRRK